MVRAGESIYCRSWPIRSADISNTEELAAEIARLRERNRRLQSKVQQLDQLAHLDPLIGLPNRRGFMRQLEALIARVKRYGDHGAMLFVDIDGLKASTTATGTRPATKR